MITLRANDTELSLDVTSYEFPEAPPDDWDAAWLQVAGRVSCERGRWSFSAPCITTSELPTLASWLMHVATQDDASEMLFLEPCLAFRREEVHPIGTIVVTLAHQAGPPWLLEDEPSGGYDIRIETTAEELVKAGKEALALARRFPDRRRPHVG